MAWNQNDDYFNAACRICSIVGHPTEICSMFQEESYGQIHDAYGFLGQPQRNDNPYLNTYYSELGDHHDFSYEDHQMHWLANQDFPDYQQFNQSYPNDQEQGQSSNSNLSLEDMFKSFMTDALQFQQETNANIQRMSAQMEQLKLAISQLEVQSVEKLPSRTMVDQEEDENEIVLSSGKDEETPETTDNGLCGDDMPKVEEVVEEKEEIEQKRDLKGATDSLNSLPVIFDKYVEFSIPSPVTHNQFLSFILQDSTPNMKHLPDYIDYLFLGEGAETSYHVKTGCNLPLRNVVIDEVRKIHEIGVT